MHYRLLLIFIFLGVTVGSPVFANSNELVGSKIGFEHYNISVPFKVNLPVIALDIITDENLLMDELVVIGADESGQTWLALYVFQEKNNNYILLDKILLADEFFALDVSKNAERMYLLSKNKVVSLEYNTPKNDIDSLHSGLTLEHKQDVTSIYLVNESSFITQKNFIQDVNKDGFDDIVLPDFEQTNLWISSKNLDEYSDQNLTIKTHVELNRDGVNFNPTRLFYGDFNLDKRQDIAWISKGSINYFSQNESGMFSQQQERIALADTIYGVKWWKLKESDGQRPDQSNLTHRVVEQIKDINGDGLVDVIVSYTQSSGVLDKANDYEFYMGFINQSNEFEFPKTPSTVIKAEGTLAGLKIVDVNNYNKFEVLLSSFELSVSNIIGALLSGGIDQNVLLFSLNDDNTYDDDALISKEVELSFSLSSGRSGEPIVLLSDVNGDELQDLVLSLDEEKIAIYLGQNTSKLFNRKASKHNISLPKNGKLFMHHDINQDGKEDFIMRYGRLDDKSMANKITILMVK